MRTGINDTGGKFANGVNNTGGKLNIHRWLIVIGINDTAHRRQILSLVLLVLLIPPVANLPPVSTIPSANLIFL